MKKKTRQGLIVFFAGIYTVFFIWGCGKDAQTGSLPAQDRHQGHRSAPGRNPGGNGGDVFAGEGEKILLPGGGWLVYAFNQRPKIGTLIVKIRVFKQDGSSDATVRLTGDAGMPSMAGSHDTGPIEFRKNRGGEHLLPVQVVMAGEWAVKVRVQGSDGRLIKQGVIRFEL